MDFEQACEQKSAKLDSIVLRFLNYKMQVVYCITNAVEHTA